MRVGLIFTFLVISSSLLGQAVYMHSIKLKSGALKLASIKDTLRPDHLLFAFADDDTESWKYTSWTQELHWLASERNALVVSPDTKERELTWSEIESVMSHYKDSVSSLEKTEFMTLGSGVRYGCDLLSHGFKGLIISPSASFKSSTEIKVSSVGVIQTLDSEDALIVKDSLERLGHWVVHHQQFSSDCYYIDGYKEIYQAVFEAVDSIAHVVSNDSNYSAKTIVTNVLPDVIRQGKQVEINIQVMENGAYSLDLLDLSAKSVFHKEMYLGKGKHSLSFNTEDLDWGVYKVQLDGPKFLYKHKLMIRG